MRSKKAPYIFMAILAVTTIILIKVKEKHEQGSDITKTESVSQPKSSKDVKDINRDRGFDRRISYIEYSEHARCRMKCRHITQTEVKEIVQKANVNYNKSELDAAQGPKYALEGYTSKEKQHVRIIVAPKERHLTIVTVIDLDEDWDCPSCK